MSSNYKFLLAFVSLWLLCQESLVAQTVSSSCRNPRFYYWDLDRDGYGNDNYTEEDKYSIKRKFECGPYNDCQNYADGKFELSSSVAYGCKEFAEVNALREMLSLYDTDCDDSNADIFPGSIWYYDNDGDGDGDPNRPQAFDCAPDPNFVKRAAADCNDNDPQIHSGTIWYLDDDNDGVGGSVSFRGCSPPANYILTGGDVCDNNPDTLEKLLWYYDADGDGFAHPAVSVMACLAPQDH
jgi:hypothetical protein